MIYDLTYADAVAKAEHLTALGETTVYLRSDEGFPYDKVERVEAGSTYRLNGPTGCYLIANDRGLTFRLSVDFEPPEANGRGVSMFDRDRLRDVMLRLAPGGREAFADMLAGEVMAKMQERTRDLRSALQSQTDSEDCIRGLIAFAREPANA